MIRLNIDTRHALETNFYNGWYPRSKKRKSRQDANKALGSHCVLEVAVRHRTLDGTPLDCTVVTGRWRAVGASVLSGLLRKGEKIVLALTGYSGCTEDLYKFATSKKIEKVCGEWLLVSGKGYGKDKYQTTLLLRGHGDLLARVIKISVEELDLEDDIQLRGFIGKGSVDMTTALQEGSSLSHLSMLLDKYRLVFTSVSHLEGAYIITRKHSIMQLRRMLMRGARRSGREISFEVLNRLRRYLSEQEG